MCSDRSMCMHVASICWTAPAIELVVVVVVVGEQDLNVLMGVVFLVEYSMEAMVLPPPVAAVTHHPPVAAEAHHLTVEVALDVKSPDLTEVAAIFVPMKYIKLIVSRNPLVVGLLVVIPIPGEVGPPARPRPDQELKPELTNAALLKAKTAALPVIPTRPLWSHPPPDQCWALLR